LEVFQGENVTSDNVAATVESSQPRDLKLQDFMGKAIPDLWQEQRAIFGF